MPDIALPPTLPKTLDRPLLQPLGPWIAGLVFQLNGRDDIVKNSGSCTMAIGGEVQAELRLA